MKEDLVTFETATLAKEKGFVHMKANCYGDNMAYQLPEGELINALQGNSVAGYILAPTLSLLQKWLREVHNISIIIPFACGYTITFNLLDKDGLCEYPNQASYDTYEEALEAGLQEALKLIE